MTEQHRALAMIAGCPNGITSGALADLHGCAMETIAELHEQGLIHGWLQRHSNPEGLTTCRFWITAEGLQQLNGKERA